MLLIAVQEIDRLPYRRNSPSVSVLIPDALCSSNTLEIAASSALRNSSIVALPQAYSVLACISSAGRLIEPMCSARKGGDVRCIVRGSKILVAS